MSEMTKNQTTIEADPDLPVIRIVREFDAPPEKVFRAWTAPELFVRWVGPRSIDTTIEGSSIMTTTTDREATIEAHPTLPTITITREFDATPERVFRAHTDADLVARWLGPKSTEMRIDRWDAETGGSYRYAALTEGEEVAAFYGSFHEVRPTERLVWTFTWEGMPDGVALETLVFEDIGDGRTRLTMTSVVDTIEARDAIMSSGMEVGVHEGYEKLDALLT